MILKDTDTRIQGLSMPVVQTSRLRFFLESLPDGSEYVLTMAGA
jgi:hypothetical protein